MESLQLTADSGPWRIVQLAKNNSNLAQRDCHYMFCIIVSVRFKPLDEPDLGCQRVASLVMRLAQEVDLGESG